MKNALSVALMALASLSSSAAIDLPNIGDASPGIISDYQEKQLGDIWLRLYRSQAPVTYDPLLNHYLDQLMIQIARYSELNNQTLSIVLVKNKTLNAFAVPGGVVGIHTGLFRYAQTQDQFASVMAHELAHLSQRHYARGLEEQRRQTLPTMAALLASLVIMASTDGDAGAAALSATQALSANQQLRFSRLFEQEADRIGIKTLSKAGMNPHSAAEMFEAMQKARLYSQEPPEFLLSHPVTENRIADAKNRANEYQNKTSKPSLEFQLMKARAQWLSSTTQDAIAYFSNEKLPLGAEQYGLALALLDNKEAKEAEKALTPLLKNHPNNIALIILQSDILAALGQLDKAIDVIQQELKLKPNDYPLLVQQSHLMVQNNQLENAIESLEILAKNRPNDPHIWYLLAEYYGLTGQILNLHLARAEFFLLKARFDDAEIQIINGLKLAKDNSIEQVKLRQLNEDLHDLRDRAKLN